MNFSRKNIIYLIIVVVLAYFLASYQLPYYIQRPGGADALDPIVNVSGGHSSEGDMHLVTVSGIQATPIQYALAKILPHNEILPLEEVFPEGISQKEYMEAQLQVMENSQEAATVVAFEASNSEITIDYNGVYVVSVLKGMPADGILQTGDRIIGIDGTQIEQADDLINYVDKKEANDVITLEVVRDEQHLTKDIMLEEFDSMNGKVGVGISLVTDRDVTVEPSVEFSSGNIGGPSAGLMFSLEIFDQLTGGDLTKGYQIAGTGEIDYNGNVYRIGGIDKKVVAADREGIDIFFAPNEGGAEGSNYEIAVQTAEQINTDMKIIPVDTFDEALEYLQELP
ncbi:SepM family pheromone-processing serine protease [Oceanobacillus senegalensis]|uniref:SepM family pheromone-processing serine protease n=1 Tax=Oceanobacillus senegalensis TaxID=1936063 RepID=UPI000A306C51|nr:SepM family pheromone-processing serine protease [Oceanobacillus senegalensis]